MILTSGLYAGHIIVVILFACFQFIVNLDTWGGAGFSKRIEVGVSIYVTEYGTALTTILPILFLYLNTVTVTAGTFEP